jgi:hypothetical protein
MNFMAQNPTSEIVHSNTYLDKRALAELLPNGESSSFLMLRESSEFAGSQKSFYTQ